MTPRGSGGVPWAPRPWSFLEPSCAPRAPPRRAAWTSGAPRRWRGSPGLRRQDRARAARRRAERSGAKCRPIVALPVAPSAVDRARLAGQRRPPVRRQVGRKVSTGGLAVHDRVRTSVSSAMDPGVGNEAEDRLKTNRWGVGRAMKSFHDLSGMLKSSARQPASTMSARGRGSHQADLRDARMTRRDRRRPPRHRPMPPAERRGDAGPRAPTSATRTRRVPGRRQREPPAEGAGTPSR